VIVRSRVPVPALAFFAVFGLASALPACASRPKVTPSSDYRVEWQAARDRFARANVLLHEGLLAVSASDLPALVDAEDRLGSDVEDELRRITGEGAAHAEAAVALRGNGVEGYFYLALNLAIHGLTRSRTAAMLEGLPRRIRAAYEHALALDDAFAAGGAYRLKGKFLMSAPWPIRDYAAAREALAKANEIAPVPQNYLFLGDLDFREGRLDEAIAAWRQALNGSGHDETSAIDSAVRELARRRLVASGSPAAPAATTAGTRARTPAVAATPRDGASPPMPVIAPMPVPVPREAGGGAPAAVAR